MREQQAAVQHEDIRCIYCGTTTVWPADQLWPSTCMSCGRGPGAYTVTRQLDESRGEQEAPTECTKDTHHHSPGWPAGPACMQLDESRGEQEPPTDDTQTETPTGCTFPGCSSTDAGHLAWHWTHRTVERGCFTP